MFANPPSLLELVIAGCVFALVLALWLVWFFLWAARRAARAERIEERLGLTAQPQSGARVLRLWHDGEELTTSVPGGTRRRSLAQRLEALRLEAELEASVSAILLRIFAAAAAAFVLLYAFSGSLLPGLGLAAGVLALFWGLVKARTSRRRARFERQFVDALELAARSLRAGHPLMGSFHLIAEEIAAPVGTLFGDMCQQQSMGMSLEEAMRQVAAGHANPDLKLFATSVVIQMRSGGNLADMMERLAFVIRDRMRLNRRVRVLTAQTQFSKRVLAALPLALFLVLNVVNPRYMEPFYHTATGQLLLAGAGGGILLGMWTMSRLAVLRY